MEATTLPKTAESSSNMAASAGGKAGLGSSSESGVLSCDDRSNLGRFPPAPFVALGAPSNWKEIK